MTPKMQITVNGQLDHARAQQVAQVGHLQVQPLDDDQGDADFHHHPGKDTDMVAIIENAEYHQHRGGGKENPDGIFRARGAGEDGGALLRPEQGTEHQGQVDRKAAHQRDVAVMDLALVGRVDQPHPRREPGKDRDGDQRENECDDGLLEERGHAASCVVVGHSRYHTGACMAKCDRGPCGPVRQALQAVCALRFHRHRGRKWSG